MNHANIICIIFGVFGTFIFGANVKDEPPLSNFAFWANLIWIGLAVYGAIP